MRRSPQASRPPPASAAVERYAGLDRLPAAGGVDGHVLAMAVRRERQVRREGAALDVHLDAVAARGAHGVAADVAVADVGGELAGQVEIVAVAGAAQVDLDLVAARAARPVVGVAADALGGAVAGLDGAVAGPGARERRERAGCGKRRHRGRAE